MAGIWTIRRQLASCSPRCCAEPCERARLASLSTHVRFLCGGCRARPFPSPRRKDVRSSRAWGCLKGRKGGPVPFAGVNSKIQHFPGGQTEVFGFFLD